MVRPTLGVDEPPSLAPFSKLNKIDNMRIYLKQGGMIKTFGDREVLNDATRIIDVCCTTPSRDVGIKGCGEEKIKGKNYHKQHLCTIPVGNFVNKCTKKGCKGEVLLKNGEKVKKKESRSCTK